MVVSYVKTVLQGIWSELHSDGTIQPGLVLVKVNGVAKATRVIAANVDANRRRLCGDFAGGRSYYLGIKEK
jgi:hypothetical protein